MGTMDQGFSAAMAKAQRNAGDAVEVDITDKGEIPNPIFTVASGKVFKDSDLYYNDASDTLANKKMQYLEIYHVPTGKNVFFKLFLTHFSDAFLTEYNKEPAFGRMDPIATYKRTGRNISLTMDVPSSGLNEAKNNLAKANRMAQFMYPVYETQPTDGAALPSVNMKSGPIFKLKMGNLIMKPGLANVQGPAKTAGLTGIIDGFTYEPVLRHGVFDPEQQVVADATPNQFESQGINVPNPDIIYDGALYPKVFTLNLRFTVLHDTALGWEKNGDNAKLRQAGAGRFPYGGDNQAPDLQDLPPENTRNDWGRFGDSMASGFNRSAQVDIKNILS